MDELETFVGKSVLVVWVESSEVKTTIGDLINAGRTFITIRTQFNEMAINKVSIIKIKLRNGGEQ